MLLFAIAFNLFYLWPDVSSGAPKLNDGVLHFVATRATAGAISNVRDPTDFWLAPIVGGYPLFHHYQHLGYLPPAAAFVALRYHVGLSTLFDWSSYMLLSFFPLSVFWSMQRFGFPRITAALGGLCAPLISTNGLYGFEAGSYVWRGYGLYTQLWGMVLLPPTLAQGYLTIRTGRGYFWSVALLSATLLSHLVLGYIAVLSLMLFVPLRLSMGEVIARIWRLAVVLVLTAAVTPYFLVPFARDRAYLNRGVWELQSKYDAFGASWTLHRLAQGNLFDYGRFPSLTILAGLGAVACIWQSRDERYRVPVLLGLVWLLLYFGRPTWGGLLDLLPLSSDMQFHRLIAGVHLAGILLIPIALGAPWKWAMARADRRLLLAPIAISVAFLYPVYAERRDYLEQNKGFERSAATAYRAEAADIEALSAKLKTLPPGRVYAGRAGNWGRDYRVGSVPMYAILQSAGFDMLGYAYHSLSFTTDVELTFDDQRADEYDVFGVRYAVAPRDHPMPTFAHPIGDFGRHRLYQVDATGYFDLVGSSSAFKGGRSDFYPAASAWLALSAESERDRPRLYLDGAPSGVPARPLSEAPSDLQGQRGSATVPRGQVISESAGDGAYEAVVRVDKDDTYALVKETFHPGWHATVDGRPADTVMLMPSFVGIKVPTGAHRVRIEYRPPRDRLPLMILGAVTLMLTALAEWRGSHVLPAGRALRRRVGLR